MTDFLRTAVTVALTQQSNLPIQASPDVPDNSLRLANTGNASIKMFDLFNKWYEQKVIRNDQLPPEVFLHLSGIKEPCIWHRKILLMQGSFFMWL
jgi:hypothetical protein